MKQSIFWGILLGIFCILVLLFSACATTVQQTGVDSDGDSERTQPSSDREVETQENNLDEDAMDDVPEPVEETSEQTEPVTNTPRVQDTSSLAVAPGW